MKTAERFSQCNMWQQLAAQHGWTDETLARIIRCRQEMDENLKGCRAPLIRESRIKKHIASMLKDLGATDHQIWQNEVSSRIPNPAKDVTPPKWVTDAVVVMYMYGDLPEGGHW